MRLLDFVVPEDLNLIADLISGAMHDATEREYRMVRPDGKIRWLRTRAFPVRDENGKVYRIAGVTDDITTRKRVADELVSRVEMNRLMTDLATGFINLPTDRIPDGIDDALARLGRFTKVDIAYVFVLGSNGSTIAGGHTWYADGQTSIRDIAIGWSIDDFPWFRDRIVGGERVSVDGLQDVPECAIPERALVEQFGLRSVYVVPMVVEGKSIGWIGFLTHRGQAVWPREHAGMLDVAAEMFANAVARKRAAEELERYREFERLVAHLATDFINRPPSALGEGILRALEDLARVTDTDWVALFLTDEGSNHAAPRYQWRSPRFSVPVDPFVVAMGPDDPLGKMIREHGVVRVDSVAGNDSLATESKERVSRLGIRAFLDVPLLADGEPFGFLGLAMLGREREWSEQSIVLLKTAAEMLANAILRIRIEQKMRKREAELAHALRLGTMGELAAGLAHELNQPLAAILGFARGCENRARAGNITSADLVSAIGKIADQALRAGEVIRTMRAHVRKGDTKRDWCDLNDLTVDALRLVDDELVQANIRLERYLADDMPRLQLDATQIEQVFLNLIRNAIDAVRNLPESERRIVISTRISGEGTVDLAVTDSGRAVSTDPEAWFQPFYTTKKRGLGLGLSISRSIAEHHGGTLFVERDSAPGTTFRLRLPCIPGEEHPR